jgi:WD40 repeat protein
VIWGSRIVHRNSEISNGSSSARHMLSSKQHDQQSSSTSKHTRAHLDRECGPMSALHSQATASDDHTWRLWTAADGELIMSGEGHGDWVGGLDFHPEGARLASASGDGTVKLWDFGRQKCVAVLCMCTHTYQLAQLCSFTTRYWQTAQQHNLQAMLPTVATTLHHRLP